MDATPGKGHRSRQRERGLRFLHTVLSASDFGGVPRDEVVHDLVGRQLGDRREAANGVASKQDDLLGLVRDLAGRCPR